MKKQAYKMIALVVLIGGMAVAAQAQSGSRTQLRASIPFEFNVGDKSMPAGEYLVQQVNPSSDRAVLQLSTRNGKTSVLVQMNQIITRGETQAASLKFNRYGHQYFFTQAWMPGNDGLAASKSNLERGAQQEAGVKPQTESVALRTR